MDNVLCLIRNQKKIVTQIWITIVDLLAEYVKNTEATKCKIYSFNRIISYKQITFIQTGIHIFLCSICSHGRLMCAVNSPLDCNRLSGESCQCFTYKSAKLLPEVFRCANGPVVTRAAIGDLVSTDEINSANPIAMIFHTGSNRFSPSSFHKMTPHLLLL